MTLEMAIERAYCYADEKDVPRAAMCYYADIAQKELALDASRLIKRFDVSKTNTKEQCYPLSYDFMGIHKVIRRASALPVNWRLKDNMLIIKDYGHIDIYYYALPETIDAATRGDYTFEVDRRAQIGIPYYMAHRIARDYETSIQCLEEWNKVITLIKKGKGSEKI